MKRIISGVIALTLLASLGLTGASCVPIVQANTGTIEVRVTDAPPGYEITSIVVTVSGEEGVRARRAVDDGEDEWETIAILPSNNPFDLTLLEGGLQQVLAMAPVPVGKYTQILMDIETVEVTYKKDGELQPTVEAMLPSGELKFVRPFNVVEGEITTLLLDFIADKSVAITGATQSEQAKVIFKPVVKLSIEQGGKGKPNKLGYSLDTTGNATAELYTAEEVYIHSGEESIHLLTSGDVEDGDEARIVVIPLPQGTTLGAIDSISWWEYNVAGYPPHVDMFLDVNKNGTYDGYPDDDVLVFEYAYNATSHYGEGGPTYGAETGAWYQTFSDDGNGPAQVDGTASAWPGSGPPGPPGSIELNTLAAWKASVTYTTDATKTVDLTTPVLWLEIEVDNWIAQTEAYVDDIVIVIGGVTYTVGL